MTARSSSMRPKRSGKTKTIFLVGFAAAAIIVAAIIVGNRGAKDEPPAAEVVASDGDAQRLSLTRTALAATENLETDVADQAWQTLVGQSPEDTSAWLNLSLNRVLAVDELAGRATNASIEASQRMAARGSLPTAIADARAAIDSLSNVSPDNVLPRWMRSKIDLKEAALLPGSIGKSKRRELFDSLADAIEGEAGTDPRSKIWGGVLIDTLAQMEDPIDGLPADLVSRSAEVLSVSSDRHPSNLFIALRAARALVDDQDTGAAKYIRRAGELAAAVDPLVARETAAIGKTPQELIDSIIVAAEADDWQAAQTLMQQWFNVLGGTEIVKTDRRLATPHPLDRLSFDSLRRLSASVAKQSPIAKADVPLSLGLLPVVAPETVVAEVIDFDLDLDADIITVDRNAVMTARASDGAGEFKTVGETTLGFVPAGLVIADLFLVDISDPSRLRLDVMSAGRHDTFPCLVAFGERVELVCIDGRESTPDSDRFVIVDSETGLEDVRGVVAAVAGDLESDGDLDLVFATESDGVRMFVNRGNRTFFELPKIAMDSDRSDVVTAIAIGDLDRDLDLDLVTTHGSGKVGLIENLLHLQFRYRTLDEIEPIAGVNFIAVEDIDANVSWDLIVGGPETLAVVFSQTSDAGSWTVDRVVTQPVTAESFAIADLDNDSFLDVVAGNDVFTLGPGGIDRRGKLKPSGDVRVGDFNRDGAIDLAVVNEAGLNLAINQTKPIGHYVDIRFKGIDDNATGRVNHFGIGSVLETRFGPHYRARIVTSPVTHFGIDGREAVDNVRVIMPNGLTQTMREVAVDTIIEEEQTLKGSCPYLYAWDGDKFRFVTDCLWAAPLGLQVADGIVAKDRPWEYLKIDGRQIKPKDGRYEFRLTEELWEVAYFDQVAIAAIDHPADVEIWTNEKVGPDNIATPTIFAFEKESRRSPIAATDSAGRDVRELLLAPERNFVKAFDRRIRQGLCPPHWVDMDFGAISPTNSAYLVMTGWILPTDTSLNIQIDQNEDLTPIEFPSIWVPDAKADGGWRNAIPFAGFPGGKTKTIVIDVSDVIDRDDARLRIRTSAQIYWDAAELVTQSGAGDFVSQAMPLVSAEVAERGFSARVDDGPSRPETYDYLNVSTTPKWPPLAGNLTRVGDATDLVRGWDNRMIVIGAGDEVRLSFAMPENDPPAGWVRDFVMHNVGWDKDADLNTLAGQKIGPLPYREMTRYPPPAEQFEASALRQELNRDHLQRTQRYRNFWRRGGRSATMQ